MCIRFALKAAIEPTTLSASDFDGLRDEGMSDEEIVALAALGNYLDTVADAMHLDIDDVFKTG